MGTQFAIILSPGHSQNYQHLQIWILRLQSFFHHDIHKQNDYSIHIKDRHKMTSIHIKDTYRITSIHPVIGTNKINFLTSILNNINQYLVIFANRKHIHSILVI
jgi:hypothetical protein